MGYTEEIKKVDSFLEEISNKIGAIVKKEEVIDPKTLFLDSNVEEINLLFRKNRTLQYQNFHKTHEHKDFTVNFMASRRKKGACYANILIEFLYDFTYDSFIHILSEGNCENGLAYDFSIHVVDHNPKRGEYLENLIMIEPIIKFKEYNWDNEGNEHPFVYEVWWCMDGADKDIVVFECQ